MKGKYKLEKTIKSNSPMRNICTLLPLNDGRIALGKYEELAIYDLKTHREDTIVTNVGIRYLYQFKDNKLYYYSNYRFISTFILIELTGDNKYIDKTVLLPKNIKAILIKEYKNKVMFSLLNEPSIDTYININEKYQLVSRFKTKYTNFVILGGRSMAISNEFVLRVYDINSLKKKKKNYRSNKGIKTITFFSKNFLLIASKDELIVFDYKNFNIVNSITTGYNIFKIISIKDKVLIAESDKKNNKSRFTTYKINIKDKFNIKRLSVNDSPHNADVFKIVQCQDGTIITHLHEFMKIWK